MEDRVNRARLRELMLQASSNLSDLAEAAIASKTSELPLQLRLLARSMEDRLPIRSLISNAATELSDELNEAELWSLKQWVNQLVSEVLGLPHELPSPEEIERRAQAIARVKAILSR